MSNITDYNNRLVEANETIDESIELLKRQYRSIGQFPTASEDMKISNVLEDLSENVKVGVPISDTPLGIISVNKKYYGIKPSLPMEDTAYKASSTPYRDNKLPGRAKFIDSNLSITDMTDREDGAKFDRWVNKSIFKFTPDIYGYDTCMYRIPVEVLNTNIVTGVTANTHTNYPYPEEILMISSDTEKNIIRFLNIAYVDSHVMYYNDKPSNLLIIKSKPSFDNKEEIYISANDINSELAYYDATNKELILPMPNREFGDMLLNTMWECNVVWRKDEPTRKMTRTVSLVEKEMNVTTCDTITTIYDKLMTFTNNGTQLTVYQGNKRDDISSMPFTLKSNYINYLTGIGIMDTPGTIFRPPTYDNTKSVVINNEWADSILIASRFRLLTNPNVFKLNKGYIGFANINVEGSYQIGYFILDDNFNIDITRYEPFEGYRPFSILGAEPDDIIMQSEDDYYRIIPRGDNNYKTSITKYDRLCSTPNGLVSFTEIDIVETSEKVTVEVGSTMSYGSSDFEIAKVVGSYQYSYNSSCINIYNNDSTNPLYRSLDHVNELESTMYTIIHKDLMLNINPTDTVINVYKYSIDDTGNIVKGDLIITLSRQSGLIKNMCGKYFVCEQTVRSIAYMIKSTYTFDIPLI